MTARVYEALIAEKMENIEKEIKRMSGALDAAKTRDNELVIGLFNSQLAKYYSAYQRLYSGSAVWRNIQSQSSMADTFYKVFNPLEEL